MKIAVYKKIYLKKKEVIMKERRGSLRIINILLSTVEE